MVKRRPLSVQVFFVIFLFMLVPVSAFSFFSNRITTDSLLEQKRRTDLRVIDGLTDALGQLDMFARDTASLIGAIPQVRAAFRERPSDVSEITSAYAKALSNVAAISLLDAGKRFIGETRLTSGRLSWFFNPSLLRKVSPDSALWTDPFTIEETETGAQYRVQALIQPVVEADECLGYLVLYLDTSYIQRLVSDLADDIYVLDTAQCIVASQHQAPYYLGLYDFTRVSYTLLMEDASAIVPVEGEKKIVTTQAYPQMNLQLVLISSFDSISDALTEFYSRLVFMCLAYCGFALFSALFITRFLTRPILQLKRLVNQATEGDLSVRYQKTFSDEIDQLGGAFNHFLDTIQALMQQKVDEQRRKRKLQLQLLQEQVRPHFLYNVLEMIYSLIQCGMSREALSAIQALARFYRISLSNGSDIISIEQEITLTESYLALQKLRYIEFMDYSITVDPALLKFSIPKLTLQPLVENAIYHGLKAKRVKGALSISGALISGQAVFEVYDTGVGIDAVRLDELRAMLREPRLEAGGSHFGLVSVFKRLNLFSGGQARMELNSEVGKSTCVRISFPVNLLRS